MSTGGGKIHTHLSRSSPHHRAVGEHLPPGDPVVGREDPEHLNTLPSHVMCPVAGPQCIRTKGFFPGSARMLRLQSSRLLQSPSSHSLRLGHLPHSVCPGASTFSIAAQMPPPPESLPGTRPSSGLLTGQGGSGGPGLAGATSGTASCEALPGSRSWGSAGPGRRRAKWSFR